MPSECEADEGESIKKNTEIRYAPSSVSLAADSFPLRGGSLGGRPKGLPYAKPNLFRFSVGATLTVAQTAGRSGTGPYEKNGPVPVSV